MRATLHLDGATDEELLEVLAERIRRAQERYAAGCGGCGPSTCSVDPD